MVKFDTGPYRKRLLHLRRDRDRYESDWRRIREYLYPDSGLWLVDDTGRERDGDRDDDKILNDAGGKALDALARGLHGGLTSPSRDWLRITMPHESAQEFGTVRVWLDQVREMMRDVMARSNFYGALDSLYREIGAFGIGTMLVLEDNDTVIRCEPLSVGQYYVAQNSKKRPDTLYRRLSMTGIQMRDEFGEESLSDSVRSALSSGRLDDSFIVIHCVEHEGNKRKDDGYKLDFPWRSIWFEEKADDKNRVLRLSGYREQPFVAPRWDVDSTNVYGRGPGRRSLPDVKQLQVLEKDKLYAAELLIRPPVQASASLENEAFNLIPGGITFTDDPSGLQAVYKTEFRIDVAHAIIKELEVSIQKSFHVDLFMSMAAQEKTMTAREVAERSQEKLVMLGPVLERLQGEMLDPIVARIYGIMERKGMIPPVPDEIAGVPLKIEYIGMLAQAQRLVGLNPMEQYSGFVAQLAQLEPTVLDKMDFDQLVDEYAHDLGVPASLVRSDDAVAELRAQRAQAQQMQQMEENAHRTLDGAKTASEIKLPGNESLLSGLLGGMGSV